MARILIVEDDFMMLKTIEHRLKSDGHQVFLAKDGQEGLQLLSQGADSYDLVITDMLMPYVSGLELINQIRSKFGMDIPVIVLSKVGNEDTILQAFELGADDYLTKPFSPNELSMRVKKSLLRR